jgi:inosine/xanthosine triphosphatase
MKIVVASKNPVKMNAAARGFEKMFPGKFFEVEGVPVPSGVGDQPKTDSETILGAMNRIGAAYEKNPSADFYVGIEGGIEEKDGEIEVFAWIVVKSKDGRTGKGRAGTFFLPEKMAELIRQGKELGEVDDIIFGRTNSKHINGTVGVLTDDVIDRTEYYVHPVILALIPFKNEALYFE